MTEYLIGIDGGGTKTAGVCTDLSGNVLTKSTTGPTSLTATSLGMASMNLVETFRQLTTELPVDRVFPKVVIGIAGLDTSEEKQHAEHVFHEVLTEYQIESLIIVNDIQLVLAAQTKKDNAVALIAGTGSQCFGRRADGSTARTSGMDYLLADQGSGYEIGRLTLRAATCSYDGRIDPSMLEEMVLKHFEVHTFDELKSKVYLPVLNKAQVAELAKVCVEAYQQGDHAAATIMEQVVNDLLEMAEAVIRRLALEQEPTDLVCSGSIAKLPAVFDQLKSQLCIKYANLEVHTLELEPAYGAIRLAMKELQGA